MVFRNHVIFVFSWSGSTDVLNEPHGPIGQKEVPEEARHKLRFDIGYDDYILKEN
jgi:hypothetical protein